jgi:hypothetical protein
MSPMEIIKQILAFVRINSSIVIPFSVLVIQTTKSTDALGFTELDLAPMAITNQALARNVRPFQQ